MDQSCVNLQQIFPSNITLEVTKFHTQTEEEQECLSVESVPSAQHIDHKKIYSTQKLISFCLTLILNVLGLQMALTF